MLTVYTTTGTRRYSGMTSQARAPVYKLYRLHPELPIPTFALAVDGNNWYRFVVEGGKLYFQVMLNGAKSSSAITYSGTMHKYWRLRHDLVSNKILWETSSDGTTWTLRNSVARQIPITALHVDIDSGTFQSVGTPGAAIFDNFKLER